MEIADVKIVKEALNGQLAQTLKEFTDITGLEVITVEVYCNSDDNTYSVYSEIHI